MPAGSVGLLTFHNSANYGAVLQTVGLARTLALLGYRPQVIDYQSADDALSALSLRRRTLHRLRLATARVLVGDARSSRTQAFRGTELSLLPRTYRHNADICRDPPIYDSVIVGSDQVGTWKSRIVTPPTCWTSFRRVVVGSLTLPASATRRSMHRR